MAVWLKGLIALSFWGLTLCKVVSSSLDHSLMLWRFQSSDSKAYRCPIMNPKHIPNPPLMPHHLINHYRYTGHTGPILDVQFSRTGSLIASSARDSTVRLWVPDLKGDSQVLPNLFVSLPHHSIEWLSFINSQELKAAAGQAAVRSVQFSPDNQKLLTASDDKAVKVFVFDCLTIIRRPRYLYLIVWQFWLPPPLMTRWSWHISCYRYGPWRERSSSPQWQSTQTGWGAPGGLKTAAS